MSDRRPAFTVPSGATDTHMHFYDAKRPGAPGAHYPGHYDVPMYRTLQQRLGLERVIVVQPNAYRDDNGVTLEAVRAIGSGARAVVVVKADVAEAEIERLKQAGAVGQRFFQLAGGSIPLSELHAIMARVHPFGWHANIQLDGRELPKWEDALRKLPGRFVIDHIGRFEEPVAPDDKAFQALLRLVDTGRCWVKLSAPYITSKTGAPVYEDVAKLARALVKFAPERMLWATNWPHPSEPADAWPDDAALMECLLDWAPDASLRRLILVDNPAELYGF